MQFCKNFTASGQKMEGFQGRKFFAREPSGFSARRRRQRAIRQVRFRFLDLWIKFGKIISKVCEGFNSGAKNKIASKAILFLAPELKREQTFTIVLPNLIHKSKKRNLT